MPSAEKTSASQTSRPFRSIHSRWRMGLTIHSCVTIHWRRRARLLGHGVTSASVFGPP